MFSVYSAYVWERGHVRERDRVCKSAHERAQTRILLIQTHTLVMWFCMSECVAPRVHPWPAALLMACSSRSASLTFQLWRFWHASGSMTRQLHISLLPAQPVICQRLTTKPQLASDHFWQIIYLLVCLPVTHTHSHRDLFSVFLRETVPLPPLPPLLLLTHPSSCR